MRLLVNLLLVVLTATGPSVCCCTAAEVSHGALGRSRTAGDAKDGSPRSCCPAHHRKPTKPTPGKAKGRPAARSPVQPGQIPGDPSCPCQEQRHAPAASLAGEGDARATLGSRDHQGPAFLLIGFTLPSGMHLGRLGGSTPSGPGLPFMSAGERLRAHHALRC